MVLLHRELFWCFSKEKKESTEENAIKGILQKENDALGPLRFVHPPNRDFELSIH